MRLCFCCSLVSSGKGWRENCESQLVQSRKPDLLRQLASVSPIIWWIVGACELSYQVSNFQLFSSAFCFKCCSAGLFPANWRSFGRPGHSGRCQEAHRVLGCPVLIGYSYHNFLFFCESVDKCEIYIIYVLYVGVERILIKVKSNINQLVIKTKAKPINMRAQ